MTDKYTYVDLLVEREHILTLAPNNGQPPHVTTSRFGGSNGQSILISNSSNSPRNADGRLILQQNPHVFYKRRADTMLYDVMFTNVGPIATATVASSIQPYEYIWGSLNSGMRNPSSDRTFQKAIDKWYSKASDLKVNLSVAFHERQKTVDYVAGKLGQIYGLYSSLRHGRLPKRRDRNKERSRGRKPLVSDLTRTIAKEHLGVVYAAVPLMNDIYGAIEFATERPKLGFLCRASSSLTERETLHGVTMSSGFCDFAETLGTINISRTTRTTIRAYVVVDNLVARQADSLGLVNPALLLWETVPYSFVVDWFYPIGPWLQAQTALLGCTVHDASTTRSVKYDQVINMRTTPKEGSGFSGGGHGNANIRITDRVRSLGIPSPAPPALKSPVSATHALNALSLLVGLFRK